MEKKMNIADFAALVGTTSKTIYGKINNESNLPVNERLKTVKEKIKGREVTLILTNSEQINLYKSLYGKDMVIDGEYYETLTDNNSNEPFDMKADKVRELISEALDVDMFDKFLTFNNDFNNRIEQKNAELMKVYNELAEVKGKQLLLEDKAGREGYYINEMNELKKENNRNKLLIRLLITVICIMLLLITGFVTYNIAANQKPTIEETPAVQPPVQEVVKKK